MLAKDNKVMGKVWASCAVERRAAEHLPLN